jgi:hypothetical protein
LLEYGEPVTGEQAANANRLFGRDSSPGTGMVFNVLVTDVGAFNLALVTDKHATKQDFMAVYTPTSTYACSLDTYIDCNSTYVDENACNANSMCEWVESNHLQSSIPSHCDMQVGALICTKLVSTLETFMCVTLLALGIFVAFAGHRYFQASLLLSSFLLYTGMFFIVAAKANPDLDSPTKLGISVGCGVVCALGTYAYWYYKNAGAVALICIGIVMGWLLASFVFATPIGTLAMWKNSFNFIMCFLCVHGDRLGDRFCPRGCYWIPRLLASTQHTCDPIAQLAGVQSHSPIAPFMPSQHCRALVFPVLLLMHPKMLTVVSTSIVGSYLFMFGMDYFMGSGLDDIVYNVFKRVHNALCTMNSSTKPKLLLCIGWSLCAQFLSGYNARRVLL